MRENPYERLAARLDALPNGFPPTEDGAELRLLANLFAPEEAALAAQLRLTRETPAQIAARVGGEPRALRKQLKEMARRGLIVRHLILPGGLAGSRDSLTWLAREVSPEVTVSIMSQYFPSNLAGRVPYLNRKITVAEYMEVVRLLDELGLENGWVQEMGADEDYRPDFTREADPFGSNAVDLK